LPLGSNFPKQKKTKCQSQSNFPWNENSSLVKNRTSPRSNEFSLRKGPSSPGKRAPPLGNNVLSLMKDLSSLWKHMFWIFSWSQSSHFKKYVITTYHWNGFEESYNFCRWKYFNQNFYAKVTIKQNFEHICSPRKLKLLLPRVHDCSPRKKRFKLLLGAT